MTVILPPLNPALFHLDTDHLWLMHCSDGPVPRSVVHAERSFLHKELWPWEMSWAEDNQGLPATLRQECARVVNGEASDISLTPTTSSGLVTVAQSFPWRSGDEVVAPLGEFPSNIWPWKALDSRNVLFREVPLWEGHQAGASGWGSTPPGPNDAPEDRLIEALSPRTRMLVVSWVRFQDGLKLDLAKLGSACRRRSIHFVVDGIQGAGTAVPDLYGCSAFATGGHKGLLGPVGQGFLWTDPTFRHLLSPSGTWLSVEEGAQFHRPSTDHDRTWLEDGRRMEPGSPNVVACAGLLESLRTLHFPGIPAIASHVRLLQERLLYALSGMPAWEGEPQRLLGLLERDRLGSILSLHHGAMDPEALQELLRRGSRRGVYGSVREGYLRVAFHGWHSEQDVDRAVDWLTR